MFNTSHSEMYLPGVHVLLVHQLHLRVIFVLNKYHFDMMQCLTAMDGSCRTASRLNCFILWNMFLNFERFITKHSNCKYISQTY